MPIKYRPSENKINPNTKKKYKEHHYMSHVPTATLLEDLDKVSVRPKMKDKIRKELVKRNAI